MAAKGACQALNGNSPYRKQPLPETRMPANRLLANRCREYVIRRLNSHVNYPLGSCMDRGHPEVRLGNLQSAAASPAPPRPRLRCGCAVTSLVYLIVTTSDSAGMDDRSRIVEARRARNRRGPLLAAPVVIIKTVAGAVRRGSVVEQGGLQWNTSFPIY